MDVFMFAVFFCHQCENINLLVYNVCFQILHFRLEERLVASNNFSTPSVLTAVLLNWFTCPYVFLIHSYLLILRLDCLASSISFDPST